MIKAHAKICGVITKAGAMHSGKNNKTFIGFTLRLSIPGARTGMAPKDMYLQVSCDGDHTVAATYAEGVRIEAEGNLVPRKRGENVYYNFYADTITVNSPNSDSITGELEFRGTVGQKVDERTDKKGAKMVSFSAFSTEKTNDGFEFQWVRFVRFNTERPAFLVPKAKIQAKGRMTVTAYMDRISFDCIADELSTWVWENPVKEDPTEMLPF